MMSCAGADGNGAEQISGAEVGRYLGRRQWGGSGSWYLFKPAGYSREYRLAVTSEAEIRLRTRHTSLEILHSKIAEKLLKMQL